MPKSIVGDDARLLDAYQTELEAAQQKVDSAVAASRGGRSNRSRTSAVNSAKKELADLRNAGITGYRNMVSFGSYSPPSTQQLENSSSDDGRGQDQSTLRSQRVPRPRKRGSAAAAASRKPAAKRVTRSTAAPGKHAAAAASSSSAPQDGQVSQSSVHCFAP